MDMVQVTVNQCIFRRHLIMRVIWGFLRQLCGGCQSIFIIFIGIIRVLDGKPKFYVLPFYYNGRQYVEQYFYPVTNENMS